MRFTVTLRLHNTNPIPAKERRKASASAGDQSGVFMKPASGRLECLLLHSEHTLETQSGQECAAQRRAAGDGGPTTQDDAGRESERGRKGSLDARPPERDTSQKHPRR